MVKEVKWVWPSTALCEHLGDPAAHLLALCTAQAGVKLHPNAEETPS